MTDSSPLPKIPDPGPTADSLVAHSWWQHGYAEGWKAGLADGYAQAVEESYPELNDDH